MSKTSTYRDFSNQLFLLTNPDLNPPATICCSPGFLPKNTGPTSKRDKSS